MQNSQFRQIKAKLNMKLYFQGAHLICIIFQVIFDAEYLKQLSFTPFSCMGGKNGKNRTF